jgi:hypothetical protein
MLNAKPDQEQQRGEHHDPDPAVPVGQRPGEPGTQGRAEQRDRHGEAEQERTGLEGVTDRLHRTVDHGRVEAEQEPAECGGAGDQDGPAGVRTDLAHLL